MLLTLDVGNTQIYGGLFIDGEIDLSFRTRTQVGSSDELGIKLKLILKENGKDPALVSSVSVSSVVPEVDYSLKRACEKYFNVTPFFLKAGVKTGLNIKYNNPHEVGSDRIADAMAARFLYPDKNLIVVDMGTATTLCAIDEKGNHLGGTIMTGPKLSRDVLVSGTSKLTSFEIKQMDQALGRSTIESLKSGLFFGHLGAMKEIIARLKSECFLGKEVVVLATGGFAHLFQNEKIFDNIDSELVLKGLYLAYQKNL